MNFRNVVSMAPAGKNKKSVLMKLSCGHISLGTVATPIVDCTQCAVQEPLGFDSWFAEGDAPGFGSEHDGPQGPDGVQA